MGGGFLPGFLCGGLLRKAFGGRARLQRNQSLNMGNSGQDLARLPPPVEPKRPDNLEIKSGLERALNLSLQQKLLAVSGLDCMDAARSSKFLDVRICLKPRCIHKTEGEEKAKRKNTEATSIAEKPKKRAKDSDAADVQGALAIPEGRLS